MTLQDLFRIQNYLWGKKAWRRWEKRVRELELEGLTRSDAQSSTDFEICSGKFVV